MAITPNQTHPQQHQEQHAPPAHPAAEPEAPRPMLQEHPDMVMLVRCYPEIAEAGLGALKAAALKAGEAVREAGAKLKAAQQDQGGLEGAAPR